MFVNVLLATSLSYSLCSWVDHFADNPSPVSPVLGCPEQTIDSQPNVILPPCPYHLRLITLRAS